MLKIAACLLVFILTFCACSSKPESQNLPAQVGSPTPPAEPTKMSIKMNDPDAVSYIVKDISPTVEAGAWRWTHDRPELQFAVHTKNPVRLFANFSLPGVSMKDTGPVTVSFFVNDHPAGKMKYVKEGSYHFESAVPAAWISPQGMTKLALQPEPVWIAPADKAHLGLVLTEAGFTDQPPAGAAPKTESIK